MNIGWNGPGGDIRAPKRPAGPAAAAAPANQATTLQLRYGGLWLFPTGKGNTLQGTEDWNPLPSEDEFSVPGLRGFPDQKLIEGCLRSTKQGFCRGLNPQMEPLGWWSRSRSVTHQRCAAFSRRLAAGCGVSSRSYAVRHPKNSAEGGYVAFPAAEKKCQRVGEGSGGLTGEAEGPAWGWGATVDA